MGISTEQVWEAFHAPLEQFIRARVSDESTAQDILQDVFLKIHQRMETLKDVRKLESWLYKDLWDIRNKITASLNPSTEGGRY